MYLAFYFHTLTMMHGQNHIKFVLVTCITLEVCISLRYRAHLPCPNSLDRRIMKQVQCNNSNPRLASNHYSVPKR